MSSDLANFRNLAFVGHPSAGKTTLADALAFALGGSERQGRVGDKTSIFDTEPEEQERQHTLQLAVAHVEKDGYAWNLLDTPGYPDFVADAISAMFAAELVIGVVSCSSGITFNLREKLGKAAELGRGRAVVVTHVDAENADFEALLQELRSSIGEVCVPVLAPDQSGSGFSAVAPPGDSNWRKRLCDRVMDACEDEDVVMEYLEAEELSEDALRTHTPNAIAEGALVPVFACNPESGVGVQELVAWLRSFAPSPATKPTFRAGGEPIQPDPDGDLLAIVFNVKSDPHVGKVCLARVVRGSLRASEPIGPGKGEKPGGLFYVLGGKNRRNAETVPAGDIAGFSKVESLNWGDSFTRAGGDVAEVEVAQLPEPMVALAVQPKSRSDEQKIGQALAKLRAEDPTFRVDPDPLTHQLVMHGMSDLHLQIIESRLKRRYGVEIETSLPRIAYRETITKGADGHHRHKKQSGGRGQFGECYLRVRPSSENGGAVRFVDKIVGGAIPRNLIPAVDKGIQELAAQGILTHSRVVDVDVELYDGKFHTVDSDEASFKKAGSMAFRDAFMKAGPVLLEPVMEVEIRVPAEDAGAIFSDLTSHRRGTVVDQSSEADGAITVIKAHVPLATMQTYHRDLKSQTAGEGTYTMRLDHYARVPANEQEKILAQFGKQPSDE